jgi:hypothetical protein
MPARDTTPGAVDRPAIPASHHAFIQQLQARNDAMGLEVTVNRGRVYASGTAQDTVAADQIEESLRTTEVSGEGDATYKVTVNRGGGGSVPGPDVASEYAARQQSYMVDEHQVPGSKPIVHDPMTVEQRKAATRAAAIAYADRRVLADETVPGQARPGVVIAPHPAIPAHIQGLAPGEVVLADRVVGAALVTDSDTALAAEQAEHEVAAVVARDAAAVRADQEAIASAQPEDSASATVDDQGRTVAAPIYADRMAKARAARDAKRRAKTEEEGT